MIIDINYQAGGDPDSFGEIELIASAAIAFSSGDWSSMIPRFHKWLYSNIMSLSENNGWSLADIYMGVAPIELESDFDDNRITCILLVEGWQHAKITFHKEEI